MQRVTVAVLVLGLVTQPVAALSQTATDIFVAEISVDSGQVTIGPVNNATNRDGYDNQPSFEPSGRSVLYTSGRPDGQTDIYRYEIGSGISRAVTSTTESEYSPLTVPAGDGFTVIRVEADSSQRLWKFDRDGSNPTLVLENVMPVGYQAWTSPETLALFVLGSPPTLQLADVRTGLASTVAENIGRSIHLIPGQEAVSFVEKVSDEEWWIRRLDLRTGSITPLVRTLSGSEDYAWIPGGLILMGSGSIIYQWDVSASAWSGIRDLADEGVESITRLAVSPDGRRIAVVGNHQ